MPRSSRRPLRSKLPFAPTADPLFKWRGTGVSRLEGLADAVFAFTVTLLVVALEVPRDFGDLIRAMEGFPAFAATFAMLMWFWGVHYTFFRRYGLEDGLTRFLNIMILLLVVFMAYPLKFLLSSAFATYFGLGETVFVLNSIQELSQLYILYGLGLGGVWFCYFLLYWRAYKLRNELRLDAVERILTRGTMCEILANVTVSLISICLASLQKFAWQPGVVYMLVGPLMGSIGWWHGTQAEKLHAAKPPRRRRGRRSDANEPA
ncbi:MAG: DUF1211 domain-containing protein [Opitutaceae bacterium]|jgi:uncharacterized membrane protein|nr:DUF1211 domain-containing protein [Opitutaceae bacterium]